MSDAEDEVAIILEETSEAMERTIQSFKKDLQRVRTGRASTSLAAESRHLVDLFIDAVKAEVADETVRDRIARALLDRLPSDADDTVEEAS